MVSQAITNETGIYAIARASDTLLAQCSTEPIHIPEAIQPHGFLLHIAPVSHRIVRASVNVEQFIGMSAKSLVGRHLQSIVPASEPFLAPLGALPRTSSVPDRRTRLANKYCIPGFECEGHTLQDGSHVLEFETRIKKSVESVVHTEKTRCLRALYHIQESGGSDNDIFTAAAASIRSFTNYDRVMIYQMNEEGHGRVIAESKVDRLDGFLGLHFPSSDIPQQARRLYLRNRVRVLSDIRYRPIPVLADNAAFGDANLDMSMCHLRSVSPVHVEYLTNMGVSATLVISIVVQDKLWGLIACHHYSPKHIGACLREACEEISLFVSSIIRCAGAEEEYRALAEGMTFQRELDTHISHEKWRDSLREKEAWLLHALAVDGAMVSVDGEQINLGETPTPQALAALRECWSKAGSDVCLRSISSLLPEEFRNSLTVAGCARSIISVSPRVELYLFRREQQLHVDWAGDPRKGREEDKDHVRLSPRLSFARWCQEVRGFSIPWTAVDRSKLREFSDFVSARIVEDSSRQKEIFLANMSHELRTPLTAIIGYADVVNELISNAAISQEALAALNTIRRNGNHLLDLINDVLDISKLHANSIQLSDRPITLGGLLNDLVGLVGAQAQQKNIHLELTAEKPAIVFLADEGRLKQILTNLLGNAVKFTDSGTISLSIVEDVQRQQLRFRVADSGIGIPATSHDKLFTPFYQAQAGYNRKYGGTGLGLALSRQLARAMRGELRLVSSGVGRGSVFELEIPLRKPSELQVDALPGRTDELRSSAMTNGEAGPIHVLLVEDGLDNQRLVAFWLKKENYQVTIANNGLEALQLCTQNDGAHGFDIILMDMQMPIMDGYTAAQKLRASNWPGPIIALTAHALAADRDKCLEAGCSDYLSKPIDRMQLMQRIRHLVVESGIQI